MAGFEVVKREDYVGDNRVEQRRVMADSIASRNIKNLSFDKARGGTLTLGGENNGNGIMVVKDESDNNRVTVDKDGIVIKDSTNTTMLDATGLVSTVSFVNSGTTNSSLITTSTSFSDLSGSDITFTLIRSAVVLITASTEIFLTESVGNTGDGRVAIFVDSVEQTPGININSGNNASRTSSLTLVRTLSAGSHTIKLRGKIVTVSAGTPQLTANAAALSYISLGK